MKHKRSFALIMAMFLASAVLAGCSSGSTLIYLDEEISDEKVTTVSFYGYKADTLDFIAIEDILRGFMNENNNIQISYEGVKGQPYWDAMQLRYKNNCADDVIMMDQEHVISMLDSLCDVKDVIDLSVFNDLVKEQVTKADGSVRFVPMTLASYCLYVNYDLLAEHGFSTPKNYGEFATICDYFKDKLKDKGLAPVICNTRRSLCSLIQGKSLFDVYRTDIKKDKTSAEVVEEYNQNPELLADKLAEGIDFIQTLFDNGWVDPAATAATLQTSTDKKNNGDLWLFSKGEQPFAVTGGWAPQRLRKVLSDDNKSMNFGLHPYPIIEDGSVLVMDVNNCVSVNSKGGHVEEAKKFLSHLTKPDSIWEYCDGQSCFSPLKNETRQPTEKAVLPTAEYYYNGRAVIGTNYRLNMPLDSYLMKVTAKMCGGMSAADAKVMLKKLLAGEEVDD